MDANELDALRNDIEDLLPDTGDILSVTRTSDGMGGWTEAWGTATAGVKCRVDHKTGYETVVGGGVQPFDKYICTLPHDATITTANRFVYGVNTFAVTTVNIGSWLGCKRINLELI